MTVAPASDQPRPPDQLGDAVALLERAIGYARGTLSGVTPTAWHRPTPCRAWDLGQLLDHLDDGLLAFTQACAGTIALVPAPMPRAPGSVLVRIQTQACTLLGGWTAALRDGVPPSGTVRVGDRWLSCTTLVGAAALEIAVHGWDVGRATGRPAPIPDALAGRLLPWAFALVGEADRPGRFEAPVTPGRGVAAADRPGPRPAETTPGRRLTEEPAPGARLLGFLGRIV